MWALPGAFAKMPVVSVNTSVIVFVVIAVLNIFVSLGVARYSHRYRDYSFLAFPNAIAEFDTACRYRAPH
jgi:hypothetical protein